MARHLIDLLNIVFTLSAHKHSIKWLNLKRNAGSISPEQWLCLERNGGSHSPDTWLNRARNIHSIHGSSSGELHLLYS